MLKRLSIQNYILISNLHLSFEKNLTVITGETGSGKSIFMDALGLLSGQRADIKSIKNKEKKCVIEGVFEISHEGFYSFFKKNDLDFEPETIIRREITPSGKSRIFINDTPTSVSILRELCSELVDIHGQEDTRFLKDQSYQLEFLDLYADGLKSFSNFRHSFEQYEENKKQLKDIKNKFEEAKKNQELNSFLLNELEEAQLSINEEELLTEKLPLLQNAEEILIFLRQFHKIVNGDEHSVLNQLKIQLQGLQKISDYSEEFNNCYSRLQSIVIEIEDIHQELFKQSDKIEYDSAEIEKIQERLDLLFQLKKKHLAQNVEELLAIQSELKVCENEIELYKSEISRLEQELIIEHEVLEKKASKLSDLRIKTSRTFRKKVLADLKKIGLENADFQISIIPTDSFYLMGKERVTYQFSSDKGIPLYPLHKVASGGERSRLMLALKNLLSSKFPYSTLIFDEIDAGVGGKIADSVGDLIQEIAKDRQVLIITHLPQTASKGKAHLRVSKYSNGSRAETHIEFLNPKQRINEIASMISGAVITPEALKQAEKLLISNAKNP